MLLQVFSVIRANMANKALLLAACLLALSAFVPGERVGWPSLGAPPLTYPSGVCQCLLVVRVLILVYQQNATVLLLDIQSVMCILVRV